jgi:nitrilase
VYADIDLNRCIQPKQMHDIVGHYNRFDVFDLRINRRPLAPLGWAEAERSAKEDLDQFVEPSPGLQAVPDSNLGGSHA